MWLLHIYTTASLLSLGQDIFSGYWVSSISGQCGHFMLLGLGNGEIGCPHFAYRGYIQLAIVCDGAPDVWGIRK